MLGYIQFDVEMYNKNGMFKGIKRFTLLELLSAQFKWDFHYQEDKQIFDNLKNILIEEF